jgi:copper chaperone CopZ
LLARQSLLQRCNSARQPDRPLTPTSAAGSALVADMSAPEAAVVVAVMDHHRRSGVRRRSSETSPTRVTLWKRSFSWTLEVWYLCIEKSKSLNTYFPSSRRATLLRRGLRVRALPGVRCDACIADPCTAPTDVRHASCRSVLPKAFSRRLVQYGCSLILTGQPLDAQNPESLPSRNNGRTDPSVHSGPSLNPPSLQRQLKPTRRPVYRVIACCRAARLNRELCSRPTPLRPGPATGPVRCAAGMKCGGCVGHVKKILESQPGVTSASVNLTTETALVRMLVPRGGGGGGGGGRAGSSSAALAAVGEKLAQVGGSVLSVRPYGRARAPTSLALPEGAATELHCTRPTRW